MNEDVAGLEQDSSSPDLPIAARPLDSVAEQLDSAVDISFRLEAWCERLDKRFDELERRAAQRHEEVMAAIRALTLHLNQQGADAVGVSNEEPTESVN